MNEVAVQKELSELRKILTELPIGPGGSTSKDGMYVPLVSGKEPKLDEFLSELRILLKYVVFDLEATRRENHYLRQMLDNRSRREDDEQ